MLVFFRSDFDLFNLYMLKFNTIFFRKSQGAMMLESRLSGELLLDLQIFNMTDNVEPLLGISSPL